MTMKLLTLGRSACSTNASLQATPVHGDAQRLQAEAAGLRRALQDAELDMQRMSVLHKREAEENLKVRHRRCLMERTTPLNKNKQVLLGA